VGNSSLAPRLGKKLTEEPLPGPAARKVALFRRMMAIGKVSGSVTLELNYNQGEEASWKVSCDVHGRPDKKAQDLDVGIVRQALGIKRGVG